jgi:hypothetical protein
MADMPVAYGFRGRRDACIATENPYVRGAYNRMFYLLRAFSDPSTQGIHP